MEQFGKDSLVFERARSGHVRYVVGLMAGTSLDGVDAALVRIRGVGDAIEVETVATHHNAYTAQERAGLLCLIREGRLADLCSWDAYLGERFAQAAQELLAHAGNPPLELVGSHGQTVWHAPDATLLDRLVPNTIQIGQPDVIAARLGVPVIADFRTRDMAYGGQGAPLVPIVDWLLLRSETEHRVALNLGGMANITVLPAGGAPETILAFDTGPANALIDLAVQWGTDGAQTYDPDGALAKAGTVHKPLLNWLMAHPYLKQSPPKSTGREVFGEALLDSIQGHFGELLLPDLVATLTEFTAASVADALQRFILPQYPIARVIVSGGGVHNRSLLRRLWERLPDIVFESSAEYGIDPDFKEAAAFAVLADRFVQGLSATYPNTTGVRQPTLAGKLALP
ncbi:MAG: anhydro-N-acetylmuramic acid kinase [Fimbriimonadales bacterium]|nr:MAG: anhydro-N-acetylmuramic acid kinase [Fimbriimonadales bacterium]